MAQPPGFPDVQFPNYVCKLRKAIYGLRQAPRAWYNELTNFLLNHGFKRSISDASLFINNQQSSPVYLIVYVDDIVLAGRTHTFWKTSSNTSLLNLLLRILKRYLIS